MTGLSVIPSARARVLIFFPHNPYPPRTGAHHVARELIEGLRVLGCELMLASTTVTTDQPWTDESIRGIEVEWGAEVSVFHGDWRDRKFIGLTGRILEMCGRSPALNSPVHTPPRMRAWFAGIMRRFRPDIVMMNYAYWDGLLNPRAPNKPIRAMYTHELVTWNAKLRAATEPLVGPPSVDIHTLAAEMLDESYLASMGFKADAAEYRIYDTYDFTIALSQIEAEAIRRNTTRTEVVRIAPTHAPVELPNTYAANPIFAAGTHVLNVLGYAYLVRRVLPDVLSEEPEFRVDVTGGLERDLAGTPPVGIRFTGLVPNLTEVYRQAAFAVVPVFRGTGVAVKVIEAMAHGLAVVALAQTVETDLAKHGENCLLASDASEFAAHVSRLWGDRALCRRLGEQARRDATEFSRRQLEGLQRIVSGASSKSA